MTSAAPGHAVRPTDPAQTAIGLSLSVGIILLWAVLHVWSVFFFQPTLATVPLAVGVMAVSCWLFVGLFIISHDAIHGSLAPGRPGMNTFFGRLTMTLYAGFEYDRMAAAHHQHHRSPGTRDDPDFSEVHPTKFLPWFVAFFSRYFSWRPFLFVNAVVGVYWLVFGASLLNIVLFYGIPAIGSAAQLFYFGTFRPHRHEPGGFADAHNARSSGYGPVVSLFTCYHFGYHREHHLFPHEPWWRLPARRIDAGTPTTKESAAS